MTGYLLIVARAEPDELHYPTKEERERHFAERTTVPSSRPELLGVFDTQENAELYVLEAQSAGDPNFFGDGCFAVLPVETFATVGEIIRKGF